METIHGAQIVELARILADPEFHGREAGTSDVCKAGVYLETEYRRIGLRPGGTAGGVFQRFKIRPGYLMRGELELWLGQEAVGELRRGQDYMPVLVPGGRAEVAADCVFVGYGISAPEVKFDEYAHVDVKGKAVFLFSGVPWGRDTPGWVPAGADVSRYETLSYKARQAAARGAVGVFVVDNPAGWRKQVGASEELRLPDPGVPLPTSIPVVHITREAFCRLATLSPEEVRNLARDIAKDREPQSQSLRGRRVRFRCEVSGTPLLGRNIIGVLPGRDVRLRQEAVVVGAHYDHLGERAEQTLFGANDNAAGVGALLAVAGAFARLPTPAARTVVFVAFDAEEIGRLGSKYYVSHPTISLSQTVLMINFDMIGRNEPDGVYVVGTRSSPELDLLHEEMNRFVGLKLVHPASFRLGRSDHSSFYYAGVPIMYLFGGLDPDYNTPGDTADKLIPDKVERVARLAFLTAWATAERSERLHFQKAAGE